MFYGSAGQIITLIMSESAGQPAHFGSFSLLNVTWQILLQPSTLRVSPSWRLEQTMLQIFCFHAVNNPVKKPAATRILVCQLSAVSSTLDNTLQLALHLCISMLTLNTRHSWGWWKHQCIRILIINQINKVTWYWSSISQTVALCSISEPDEIVCCTESSGNVQKNCLEERTHFQKVPGRWLDEPSVHQPISRRALP